MAISSSRYTRYLLLGLLLLGAGALAAAGFLAAQEPYTVYDGETAVVVSGNYATVQEVIAAAGLLLRPEDVVIPSLDAPASPGVPIQVRRARAVTLRLEAGGTRAVWTQAITLGQFLDEMGVDTQRATQIFADRVQIPYAALYQVPLPREVEVGRFLTVTIQDGGEQRVLRTAAQTVGAALAEAGLTLYAADGVQPPLGSWLEPGMTIQVRRSMPLGIQVDGRIMHTRSHHTNALDVLAEAGIGLIGEDYALPGPDTPLRPNDTISVIRVSEDFRLVDQPIPFQTVWQATDSLDLDQRAVISYGQPGILRQRVRVRYENGVEVSQTPDGEWVARAPVNEVIGYGTRITIGVVDTPQGPREYWRVVRMRVTSYTAATSGKSPGDPGYGITASGRPAGYGIVAADRTIVPFRSHVYVPGYGVAFVGDTGGGVRGRWIDLGYDENNFVPWSGYVDVYYLTPVPAPENINYLLPTHLP